jgi:diamine N-acetyltransferase
MTISIRFATASDAPTIVQLWSTVHAMHVSARPDVFKPFNIEAAAASLTRSTSQRVLVAEKQGVVVGYAVLQVRQRAANAFCFERRWLELDNLGVHPDHRRGGVARSLVARAKALARDEGFPGLELNSWCFNSAAQAAFAAMGLCPQSTRFESRNDATKP